MNDFNQAIEELLGRAGGPMHIRLLLQPIVAIILAIRAGLRDARENNPPFFLEFVKNKAQRKVLINTALKDIGRLMILAFLLDSIYQLIVLKEFYLLQALIVTCALAILPYVLLRGLVTRVYRRFIAD